MAIHITRPLLLERIAKSRNQFISLSFIKKDGSTRKLLGMFGVKKHLRTEGTKPTVDTNKFFVIYDIRNKGYRAVNKETIFEAKIGGIIYNVLDKELT